MEDCELCGNRAWIYCESDQAKLCWNCDEKVHGANFLAAKHSRILLCRVCQSPTAWQACGPKLTRTASVCERCVADRSTKCEQLANDDMKEEEEEEDDDGDYDSDNDHNDEDEDKEEGENQVVQWSSAPNSLPPPPPLASSSNSMNAEGDLSSPANGDNLAVKVVRENSVVDSDKKRGCFSLETPSVVLPNDESTCASIFRPSKQPRVSGNQFPMVENKTEGRHGHNQRW